MAITDLAALAERARNLGLHNGLRQLRVTLDETATPPVAIIDASFWNKHQVNAIATADPVTTFPVSGGHRLPAGPSTGMVQVKKIETTAAEDVLRLFIDPIGDYSTYTLSLHHAGIDPLFAALDFKFRPGCFSLDCAPEVVARPRPDPAIAMDTLARDYDSFRHTLIGALERRIPGWHPTSEADLSVTLLDLFSAAADELADYQDRVMNEAYLATARNRVSLARHARLVDYQVHQGNQASTLLALRMVEDATLARGFEVWTDDPDAPKGTTFATIERVVMMKVLDAIGLYTWDDARPALAKGDTVADLAFASVGDAQEAAAHFHTTKHPRLLIEEALDPRTGGIAGRNPNKRQLLRVTSAKVISDPLNPAAGIVRIGWRAEDALQWDFCFVETPVDGGAKLRGISRFHGNLVMATSGAIAKATFDAGKQTRWGTLYALPVDQPLLYRDTPPDGTTVPISTLEVSVEDPATATVDHSWRETISLVGSRPSDPHFAVETDELLRSTIRFGNGTNGAALPDGARVRARWRSGLGLDGNIGRDRLVRFDAVAHPEVEAVWNPFDAINGRSPEPAAEVRRKAPEAYRHHQLRAVTLADYVARAEEVPGVQRAAAQYQWAGSWRTVRITIDPLGSEVLEPALAESVADHLEALRLIGEDLEVRPPVFVPLRIELTVCVAIDVWPQDVRIAIEEELSDTWTRDGRRGLFHPDNWTFGQALYESEIAGRLLQVGGVEHIAQLKIFRWNSGTAGDGRHVEVAANEIIQVRNDPDHMERGSIELVLVGGRQ